METVIKSGNAELSRMSVKEFDRFINDLVQKSEVLRDRKKDFFESKYLISQIKKELK